MKHSKAYSDKIKKWYRSLKRGHKKREVPVYEDPVEAVVYALLSEKVTERQAQTVWKRCWNHFLDLNDLRVARPDEIVEIYGKENQDIRNVGLTLANVLFSIFDKYHEVTLEPLRKLGKRQIRQELEAIKDISPFAVNYCLLTAFQAHAVPLTDKMVTYLKTNELVDPEADLGTIEGFLTKQISAKEGYTFYTVLRTESEGTIRKARKTTKKAAKKKTTRKTTAKKKTKKTTTKKRTTRKKAKRSG